MDPIVAGDHADQPEEAVTWGALRDELLLKILVILESACPNRKRLAQTLSCIRLTCKAWHGIVSSSIRKIKLSGAECTSLKLAQKFPALTSLNLSSLGKGSEPVERLIKQLPDLAHTTHLVLGKGYDLSAGPQYFSRIEHLQLHSSDGLDDPTLAPILTTVLSQLSSLTSLELHNLKHTNGFTLLFLNAALICLPKLSVLTISGGTKPLAENLYDMLFAKLTQISQLELLRLQCRQLPMSIAKLQQLTSLTFAGESNKSSSLPQRITELTNLQVLDLTANKLQLLPVGFFDLTKLQVLRLGLNRLTDQLGDLAQLSNLCELDISNNKLGKLPSVISSLAQLTKLDVGHNSLVELPAGLCALSRLRQLYIGYNALTDASIPEGLTALDSLEEVDVSGNAELTGVPLFAQQAWQATQLRASSCCFGALPDPDGLPTTLVQMDVSDNEISKVPTVITTLTRLVELRASHNKFATLPTTIGRLRDIRHLDLSHNKVKTSVPESIGKLTLLEYLDLSDNRLIGLPRSIGECASLQHLDLSNNKMRNITSSIGNLMQLRFLSLAGNRLRHLPQTLPRLTKLHSLLLHCNALEDLPEGLAELRMLVVLDLSHNRLRVLTEAVARLRRLRKLRLTGNPFCSLPTIVVELQTRSSGCMVEVEERGWEEAAADPAFLRYEQLE